jgi:NCAIR mutase (PurE)-related protein
VHLCHFLDCYSLERGLDSSARRDEEGDESTSGGLGNSSVAADCIPRSRVFVLAVTTLTQHSTPDTFPCHSPWVTTKEAIELLEKFRAGGVGRDEVVRAFQVAPVVDLGFAQVDTHRALRKGFPEVIFGAGKTPAQVLQIASKLLENEKRILITRATTQHAQLLRKKIKSAVFHEVAHCITIDPKPLAKRPGSIAVICAGTSDLSVAEEAALAAEIMGHRVVRIADVGVAGLHRILGKLPEIQKANVVVVVAGMEGALPSVVAGLISKPVIAVPTSVGYGASFGGLAALLGMLNSCGTGVVVVNIDNGFGAGYAAAQINALAESR